MCNLINKLINHDLYAEPTIKKEKTESLHKSCVLVIINGNVAVLHDFSLNAGGDVYKWTRSRWKQWCVIAKTLKIIILYFLYADSL